MESDAKPVSDLAVFRSILTLPVGGSQSYFDLKNEV
jgi:hypothetical protein